MRDDVFRPAAPLALGALVLLVAQTHGFLVVVLPALPLLLLLSALLFGVYPGCEAAVRIAERIAARTRPGAVPAGAGRRPLLAPRRAAHGGLLIACSLSGRAPPA